jgi:oligoendopeptidase F
VYKYATGLSAAVSLAHQVLAGVEGSVEKYLGFLKSGGSEYPLPTLWKAGVDMSQPTPIEQTLALFERRVEELETLLA